MVENSARGQVHVVDHPLIKHKLSLMRDKGTPVVLFRQLLHEIGMLLAFELTKDFALTTQEIDTPLTSMKAPVLDGKKVVLAAVLRAGTGMLDGMLAVVPCARVGHVGLYRDPDTLEAVEYYFKMPGDLAERQVIVVDPMLATGHTAVASVGRVLEAGAKSVKFASLLAAPEGVAHLQEHFPQVSIYTAAIDSHLNDHGYIVPGLGDAGDRMYGTQ